MARKVGASVAGAAGAIAILTLLSRLVGFVRVWVQNGALGDTQAGVAFSTSNTVPNVLFEVTAGGALAGAVIPLVSGFLARKMDKELEQTASALTTWILAIGLPIAAVVALAAHPVSALLLGLQAPEAEVDLAATLLRMFALQIPLYGLSVVFTGILQAHRKFILPALAPMLSSLAVIGVFLAFGSMAGNAQNAPEELSRAAVYVLGWGTTLGVVLFSLPQLVPVLRIVRLRPTFRFPDGVLARTLRLAGGGLAGLLAQQIQIVAVMVYANSWGGTGAYPIFTFANAVYMVPYAVLAVPIATAVFPRLSAAAALEGRPGLEMLTARSTRLVLEIGFMCVALLAVLAKPAKIVFDALRPAEGMDIAMIAMAPGLVGYGLIYHCTRVLQAVESSRSVAIASAAAWLTVAAGVGILALAGIGGRTDALVGIGAAISAGMTVGACAELIAVRKAVGPDATSGMGRAVAIMAVAMAIGGGAAWAAVEGILTLSSGLAGALAAVVAGGVLVVGCGGGAIWLLDRSALRLTGKLG